ARTFAEKMSAELKIDVSAAAELRQATHASDVIVTCTPARKWLVGREHVRPGAFVAAIGTDSPDKQEIEPELLAKSAVVCDLTAQCVDVGDLHHAIAAKLMTAADVRAELGQVVAGLRPGRKDPSEVVVFDSTG